jgi:hypothetical protein
MDLSARPTHNTPPQDIINPPLLKEQATDRFPGDGRDSQSPLARLAEQARLYRRLRSYHRGELAGVDRDDMPGLMRLFRPPPSPDEERLLLDWLAERDALVDRAMALAYVVGTLQTVVSGTRYWSAKAVARMGETVFAYPVDGEVSWRNPAPKNGDGVLVTRGWASLSSSDTAPRPYHPLPHWFLPTRATG